MVRCCMAITFLLPLLALNDAFSPVGLSSQAKIHHQKLISSPTTLNGLRVPSEENQQTDNKKTNFISEAAVSAALFLALTTSALPALAVSGGGLDYANLDITGQDFSNNKYKGKDFTQVIAKGTNFANSNLQGCRFYKAYLVNADFTGADLRGASLEDTSMSGASLKGANAAGAYFGDSILEVETMENADFTDAQIQPKLLSRLCDRDDVKGTNPSTGADTRESLMCP